MLQQFVNASKRQPVLRLSLNGTAIELPLDLLARTVREHLFSDILYNRSMAGLTPKERTWRLTMKGGMDVSLALIESEIVEHNAADEIPLPITDPKILEAMGHDILSYGMEYVWGLLFRALSEAAVDATAHIEERDGEPIIIIDDFVPGEAKLVQETGLAQTGEPDDTNSRRLERDGDDDQRGPGDGGQFITTVTATTIG